MSNDPKIKPPLFAPSPAIQSHGSTGATRTGPTVETPIEGPRMSARDSATKAPKPNPFTPELERFAPSSLEQAPSAVEPVTPIEHARPSARQLLPAPHPASAPSTSPPPAAPHGAGRVAPPPAPPVEVPKPIVPKALAGAVTVVGGALTVWDLASSYEQDLDRADGHMTETKRAVGRTAGGLAASYASVGACAAVGALAGAGIGGVVAGLACAGAAGMAGTAIGESVVRLTE